MQVLLVKPGEAPQTVELEASLAAMQAMVGGMNEAVYPFDEPVALVCNEEGKLEALPLNRVLRHPETGDIYDVVAGPFILCAAPGDCAQFEGLTGEQLARYAELFHRPEFFLGGAHD